MILAKSGGVTHFATCPDDDIEDVVMTVAWYVFNKPFDNRHFVHFTFPCTGGRTLLMVGVSQPLKHLVS